MARTVAVLGAAHIGKSTLVDQLCRIVAGAEPPKPSEEMRVAGFDYLGEAWRIIDCPGAIERLQASIDALLAADAAVICVSPDPAEAILAAPYLRAAEASGTPMMLLVNRVDAAEARARDVVAALQGYASRPLALRQVPIRDDGGAIIGAVDLVSERAWRYRENEPSALIEIPDSVADREQEARAGLLEDLSAFDDWLLEEIVEDRSPADAPVYAICKRVLAERRAIPVLIGSALHGNGLVRLMKALRHEAPLPAETRRRLAAAAGVAEAEVAAVSFRVEQRRHVGKTTWLRVFDERLTGGASLGGAAVGVLGDPAAEKLAPVGALAPGDLAAAAKADHLSLAALYGAEGSAPAPAWRRPLAGQYRRVLTPIEERDDAKLSEALGKWAETDASLQLSHDAETGAHVVCCQGALHLRRLRAELAEVFGVETRDAPLAPAYRETITRPVETRYRHKKQSGGAGQFADVALSVAPADRGEGFLFDDVVKGGAVPKNYIPAVAQGAEEAMRRGPLGFAVLDVAVTLTDGLHHAVDSSDMAFRIAGRHGVAEALAGGAPVLLEPIYAVRFTIPSSAAGSLVQIVSAKRGQVLGFDRDADAAGWDVFRAELPGAALDELVRDVRAATQGVGRFDAALDHYQEFYGKAAEAVIAERAG